MKYQVIITPDIENLILAQALYIADDSIDRALTWVDELRRRILDLSDMPRAHPLSEIESARLGCEIRKLNHGDYLVFYRVDDEAGQVVTVGFRHGARQAESD